MTRPLWQRYAELSQEAKDAITEEMVAYARERGREAREREIAADPTGWKRLAARLQPEIIDENDYDVAYHRGSL
jgi:hypothetical protein